MKYNEGIHYANILLAQKVEIKLLTIDRRAVLFWLFPKTVNLPPKPVGFWLTFIQ